MEQQAAVATTLIDNDQVRVTRFDFNPGAHTGWHRHEHDYVITAITDLNMRLEEPGDTEREVKVAAGEAYFRNLGIEHNVDLIGGADWVIDLGPEGGELGGEIVAQGPPDQIPKASDSYTGAHLAPLL